MATTSQELNDRGRASDREAGDALDDRADDIISVGEPIPIVAAARYTRGYRIWVRFADGLEGEIDLESELWGEVFEPLRDIEEFKRFRVDFDTLVWPTGASLAPEFVHEQVQLAVDDAVKPQTAPQTVA